MMHLTDTQQKILDIAENEFMTYGFQKASLRNIAKTAGLTTGAVYGYYKDKESLFSALVSEPADELMAKFIEMRDNHAILEGEEKINEASICMQDGISFFCDYIYEHRKVFYLIMSCSEGTKYHSYIEDLIGIEEDAVHSYLEFLIKENKINRRPDDMLVHILVTSSFNSVFEVAAHDMIKEKALEYAKNLADFYVVGWNKILGL